MDTEREDTPADASQEADAQPRIKRLLATNGRLAWQVVGILFAIGLLGFALARIKLILLAGFVSVVIAAVIEPVAVWFERRGLGRRAATSVALVLMVVTVAGAATVVGYRVADQTPSLVDDLQSRRQALVQALSREPLSLSEDEVTQLVDRALAAVGSSSAGNGAAPAATDVNDGATGSTEEGSASVATSPGETDAGDGEGPSPDVTFQLLLASAAGLRVLGYMLVGVVLSFFLVRDRARIVDGLVHQLAGGAHDRGARKVLHAAWQALHGYVRASVIVGALEAVTIGVALVIVGTPLAGALALLTFAGAFIPVVGATVAGLLAVGVTWLGVGGVEAIIIGGVVLVVQQFDGNVLQPTIVAANTRLHPIATILALMVGGLVGGLLGALLAVPMTAVVVAVVNELQSAQPT